MKTYLSHCLNPTLNKCKHRYIVEDGCGKVEAPPDVIEERNLCAEAQTALAFDPCSQVNT